MLFIGISTLFDRVTRGCEQVVGEVLGAMSGTAIDVKGRRTEEAVTEKDTRTIRKMVFAHVDRILMQRKAYFEIERKRAEQKEMARQQREKEERTAREEEARKAREEEARKTREEEAREEEEKRKAMDLEMEETERERVELEKLAATVAKREAERVEAMKREAERADAMLRARQIREQVLQEDRAKKEKQREEQKARAVGRAERERSEKAARDAHGFRNEKREERMREGREEKEQERLARERRVLHAAKSSAQNFPPTKGDGRERIAQVTLVVDEPGPRVGKLAFPSRTTLGELEGTCSQRMEGWWHYEICHGFNVTQYRAQPVEKCVVCTFLFFFFKDPQQIDLGTLGQVRWLPARAYPSQSAGDL